MSVFSLRTPLIGVAVGLVLAAGVACVAPGEEERRPASEAGGAGEERSTEATDVPDRAEVTPGPEEWLGEVTLGRAISPEGRVVDRADSFEAGDLVHLGVEIDGAPAGAAVRVVFVPPDGSPLGEDEKRVPAGASHLVFQSPGTSGWEPGEYRAEVWVGDERVASRPFTLRPGRS